MSFEALRKQIDFHPTNADKLAQGYHPVYSASEAARVLIVGQAPGIRAQVSDTPWNDVSGDTLRSWLGLSRETFYDSSLIALVPMDFYFPGKGKSGDLPPRKDFAPLWHPPLLALMPNIQLTILIGQYAQRYYLGARAKSNLTETVRCFEEYLPTHLPLVHPSPLAGRWRFQNPWFLEEVVPVARNLIHDALI